MYSRALFTAFILASLSHIGRAEAQPFPVWVTSSLERTSINGAPGANPQASISAAKGESESFQINIQAPTGGLTITDVIPSDLVGPAGQVISHANYTLYAERYVLVSPGSPNWQGSNQPAGAGWYADELVPFANPLTGLRLSGTYQAVPAAVAAGSNYVIWIDLNVPRKVAAGQYNGSVQVVASTGAVVVPVSLKVWNFVLPLQPSEGSSFIFQHAARMDWYQELLRHRLMPLVVSNCASQIGSGLPANSCAGDPQTEELLMQNAGLDMTNLRFWSGTTVSNCVVPPAPSAATVIASAATHQQGLSLYNYSFDEIATCPNLSAMVPVLQSWARNLHAAGVKNLVTMAPTPAATPLFDDGTGRPAVDIWAMLPLMYDGAAAGIPQAEQSGQVWSYNALVQDAYSPKWEIDFSPINFRIQPGFIHQSLGITGLLYWSVDLWGSDPWNNVNNVGAFSPTNNYPGEGTLMYPGDQVGIPGGVVPSIRLKWMRDGMDDFDYVEALKGLGQKPWALSLINSIGSDWTNWTKDINALYLVRDQIGSHIDQLNGSPTISAPAALPVAVVTAPYSATTLVAAGGLAPYRWSAAGLPSGLNIDAGSGAISGTPSTAAGSPFTVQITVMDAASNVSVKTYAVVVDTPPAITAPATLPTATANASYSVTTAAVTGGIGPYTWSGIGLPAGLTINASSGTISGTPATATGSPFTVQITVTDSNLISASRNYSLVVNAGQPVTQSVCDLNHDGVVSVADVQILTNEAVGLFTAVHDLNGDGVVNILDVILEVRASLGLGCPRQSAGSLL